MLGCCLLLAGWPASAVGPLDQAKVLAGKGAALFAKGEYFDAAQAFDKAYSLDPRDFRVLRYAGRAWQEIGFYERAQMLLERYYAQETDPKAKETLLPNLEKLRQATPRDKAEALERGAAKYPQAKLEQEAAKAYEALGDPAAMQKAAELLEVARMAAAEPAEKDRIAAEIARLKKRKVDLHAEAAAAARDKPVALAGGVTAAQSPDNSTQMLAIGGGGALVAVGATLLYLGAAATDQANSDFKAKKISYSQYRDSYSAANVKYFGGMGLAAAGALGAVAGWLWLGNDRVAVRPADHGLAVAWQF